MAGRQVRNLTCELVSGYFLCLFKRMLKFKDVERMDVLVKKDVENMSLKTLFLSVMAQIQNKIPSENIRRLTEEVAEGIVLAEGGLFEKDIRKILCSPNFKTLFQKTQIYTGSYDENSRGIHVLEVALCNVEIGKSMQRQGAEVDFSLIIAQSFAHDIKHTPFAHVSEKEIDQFLQITWRHADQLIWDCGYLQEMSLSPEVLDAGYCHSDLPRVMPIDSNKNLDIHEWLGRKNRINSSAIGASLRPADKFANGVNDIYSAKRGGVDVAEAEAVIMKKGGKKEFLKYLISGIRLTENSVEILPEQNEEYMKIRRFCYGDEVKGTPGKIHNDPQLMEERAEHRIIIRKVLYGMEYLISSKKYLAFDNFLICKSIKQHLKKYKKRYEMASPFPVEGIPVQRVMAKDIFTEMNDLQVFEAHNNLLNMVQGDNTLHEILMRAAKGHF